MEKLLKALQNEVGLSQEQAVQTIACIKKHLNEIGGEIDFEDFLKGKANTLSATAKAKIDELTPKAEQAMGAIENWADETGDKMENLAEKAKDFFDDLKGKISSNKTNKPEN